MTEEKKKKLYLGEALGLLAKTLPFIWVRLGVYALVGVCLLFYLAVAGGIAWLLGQAAAPLGIIVFLGAVGGAWGLVYWAKRYFLYLLQAAHIAVMTEHMVHGRGPEGSQLQFGKDQVMSRFKETSVLFAVDRLLHGIVTRINRTFASFTRLLPIPGMNKLNKVIEKVSRFSVTYIDAAILSRAFRYREQSVWEAAQDGVILYAQSWKPVLANAVALTVLSYLEMAVVIAVLGLPAILIGLLVDIAAIRIALAILVLVGVWMFKLALSDAYAVAATLLAYHHATDGMEPDPEWKARLEEASGQFRKLRDRAVEAVSGADRKTDDAPDAPAPAEAPSE